MTTTPITLGAGWVSDELMDNPNLTEDQRDAIAGTSPDDINTAIHELADDAFWQVADDLRDRVIRFLTEQHQSRPVEVGDVNHTRYEPEW